MSCPDSVAIKLINYSRGCLNRHTIDINIDIYYPTKAILKKLCGHLALCLRVSRPAIFTVADVIYSAVDLQSMRQGIIKSLSLEEIQKLWPAWMHFLLAFSSVVSRTSDVLNVPQVLFYISEY